MQFRESVQVLYDTSFIEEKKILGVMKTRASSRSKSKDFEEIR